MRTFVQKQNQPQKRVSSSLTRSNTATSGLDLHSHSILHLQRTIGNQAVQRMLQTNAEELKVGLTSTASPLLGHDFSRIPIHPPAATAIQTKLAINKPGDIYEHEADRITEQVMRMPEPQLQRGCACGGGCPKCQTEQPGREHESLQTKRVQASDTGQMAAPPIVHEVLRSPGQPLDPATRAFMEPRFGHDFSKLRMHTDAKAAESAQAVNARAYTAGQDVVFGVGEYAPQSAEGRRLLAHELTHVMQQQKMVGSEASVRRSQSAPVLQRSPARKSDPNLTLRALSEGFEKRVDAVAAQARSSRVAIVTALRDGIDGLDVTRADLEAVAAVYTQAYERFDQTLKRGQAEEEASEAMKKLVLGIAIGVATGVPLSAALSGMVMVRTLDRALIEFGNTMVNEGVQKTLMPGGGPAAPTAQAATEAFAARANPTLKRLEIFQQLTDLYRELVGLGLKIDEMAQVSEWCVEAKADAREFALTGRHRTLSALQLDMRVSILEGAAESQKGLGDQLAFISGRIRDAQKAASAASAKADPKRMERQLWIHWMGSLPPDDADLLGADAISGELYQLGIEGGSPQGGDRSLINWYPGDWLSGDDKEEAVKRAQIYSAAIAAVGQIGVLQRAQVHYGEPTVKQDWRGNVLSVTGNAKTVGQVVLSGQPGDARTPWARANGLDIEIYNEAENGDAIRIVGVRGGYDEPMLIGQKREDERRGLPAPDLSKSFSAL